MNTPTLADLIDKARNSDSPLEREYAVRTAYLIGAVDAIDRKANAQFEAAPRFATTPLQGVSVTRVPVGAAS